MTRDDCIQLLREEKERALKAQEAEILSNFHKLSSDSRIQVVLYSRELLRKEETTKNFNKWWSTYSQLNDEDKKLSEQMLFALTQNPQYRR